MSKLSSQAASTALFSSYTFVLLVLSQGFNAGHQDVVIAQKFIQQKAAEAVTKTLVLHRIWMDTRRQGQGSMETDTVRGQWRHRDRVRETLLVSPSVTTMTGMLSLCRVLWDRRRKPYSREYSTMYSS